MNRILVSWALGAAALLAIPTTAAAADQADPEALEQEVRADCAWLDAAIADNPGRDDAFGGVMKALQDQCRVVVPKLGTDRVQQKEVATLHDEVASLRDAVGPLASDPAPAEGDAASTPAEEGEAGEAAPAEQPHGVTGTWHQEPQKALDYFVRRTLELVEEEDGSVTGELIEVTWRKAPMSWVQSSCDGNPVFRAVTSARVRGNVEGDKLELVRNRPQVVECTCGARCRAERRRRGYSFDVGAARNVLRDDDTVFVREGARAAVGRRAAGADAVIGAGVAVGPRTVDGVWETEPFKRAGATHVIRLDLDVDGDDVTGSLSERVSQELPLATWRDRFCDGSDRFEFVEVFDIRGSVDDGDVSLRFRNPRVLSCTCPSKCRTPRRRRGLQLDLSPEGSTLEGQGLELHRVSVDDEE